MSSHGRVLRPRSSRHDDTNTTHSSTRVSAATTTPVATRSQRKRKRTSTEDDHTCGDERHDEKGAPASKRPCRRHASGVDTSSSTHVTPAISIKPVAASAARRNKPLTVESAARIIWNAWRRYRTLYPAPLNEQDPITLESWHEIRQQKQPIFVHVFSNNSSRSSSAVTTPSSPVTSSSVYWFRADALLRTITETGRFSNPITQVPFNNVELHRLERLLRNGTSSPPPPNLVLQRRRIVHQVRNRVNDQAMMDYLENVLVRIIALGMREMSRGLVDKAEYLESWKAGVMRKYRQLRQYMRDHTNVHSLSTEAVVQRGIDKGARFLSDADATTVPGLQMATRFVLWCTKLHATYMRLYTQPQACSDKDNLLMAAVQHMLDPDSLLELEDSVADSDDELLFDRARDNGLDDETSSDTSLDMDTQEPIVIDDSDDDGDIRTRRRQTVHTVVDSDDEEAEEHDDNVVVVDPLILASTRVLTRAALRQQLHQEQQQQYEGATHEPANNDDGHIFPLDIEQMDNVQFMEALRQIEEGAGTRAAMRVQLPSGVVIGTFPVQIIPIETITREMARVIASSPSHSIDPTEEHSNQHH